jgi:serine/threonine protein kinase
MVMQFSSSGSLEHRVTDPRPVQSSAVDWWTFGILIYEMAYGFTPFKGDTQHATFSNICATDKINIPDKPDMSPAFKKMIRGLLARDPAKRLGSKHGAPELKKCEFLQDVPWASIRKQTPPYLPQVSDPLDPKNQGHLRDTPDAALDACLAWAPQVADLHKPKPRPPKPEPSRDAGKDSDADAAGVEGLSLADTGK